MSWISLIRTRCSRSPESGSAEAFSARRPPISPRPEPRSRASPTPGGWPRSPGPSEPTSPQPSDVQEPAGSEPPTGAELKVLRLLATDLSAREIGTSLFISINTVRTHIRELYRKLDVNSRAEAVARAGALGLLGDESRR